MLYVKTPEEVTQIINALKVRPLTKETIALSDGIGRILTEDVVAGEYIPDFNRSTVDGYAVFAKDTFGSSESIPAVLPITGDIIMGEAALAVLQPGTCISVPTGGDVPVGSDAVVMLEYTEAYGDGTIGIMQPVAPGDNLIFRGDDTAPGCTILKAGHRLAPHDIGALAALGMSKISVWDKPVVGILSTGDELIDITQKPQKGQIRDVNSALLAAVVQDAGGVAKQFGILSDDEILLKNTVLQAVETCDLVLISGGSSVGAKDATARVIEQNGDLLFHGIAIKPGKPTIMGLLSGIPVFGLPGHPVAAYYVTQIYVRQAVAKLLGTQQLVHAVAATLDCAVASNHGRAEYIAVKLEASGMMPVAHPLHGKSGLIVTLTGSDGFISIPRDCEGLPKGATLQVTLWQ